MRRTRAQADGGVYTILADLSLATLGLLAVCLVTVLLQAQVRLGERTRAAAGLPETAVYEGAGFVGYYADCATLEALVPARVTLYCDRSSGTVLMVRRHEAVRLRGREYPAATVFAEFRGRFGPTGFRGREVRGALSTPGARVCPAGELEVPLTPTQAELAEFGERVRLQRRGAPAP